MDQARWFRAFWQSDAPKVGEVGAKGFAQWVAEQHGAPVLDPIDATLARPPAAGGGGGLGWSGWLEGIEDEAEADAAPAGVPEASPPAEDAEDEQAGSDLEAGRVPEDMDEIDEV